jgi:hypothetical protein
MNMKQCFAARAVSANVFEDLNTFVVCLAEEPEGSGRRLELQRALSFDEQDRRNGMDTYCVSTEIGASHYGGVRSWRVTQGVLTMELDAGAAKALGASAFDVELQVSQPEIEKVVKGLRRVLSETTELPGMQ